MINPELEIGQEVILLHMEDETSIPPGTKGKVVAKSVVFGDAQYTVKWENGSQLAIISSCDLWDTPENMAKRKKRVQEIEIKKKSITEVDEFERSKKLIKNIDVFNHFNMRFLNQYLKMVRESGIVNMFGASPYLYLGKDRIEHEFKYKDIHNEEAFEQVLENANQAQAEMIDGVINVLNSEGKEESLENINRYIQRYAQKVLLNYIHLF
jgi:hypothetical protein